MDNVVILLFPGIDNVGEFLYRILEITKPRRNSDFPISCHDATDYTRRLWILRKAMTGI